MTGERTASGEPSPATLALRNQLGAKHCAPTLRFLWKTDAMGRIIDISTVLEAITAVPATLMLGRALSDMTDETTADAPLLIALSSKESWSGIRVAWRMSSLKARLPTTLGAFPIIDALKRFNGYSGYGLLHLSQAYVVEDNRSLIEARQRHTAIKNCEFLAENVVSLRPLSGAQRQEKRASLSQPSLSEIELLAFDEIARALADESPQEATSNPLRVDETFSHQTSSLKHLSVGANKALLDRLPISVMVVSGEHLLFVNQALLQKLGYINQDALIADGGLTRMLRGRSSIDGGAITAQDFDLLAHDVTAHVETIDWDGLSATMVLLLPKAEHQRGPEESTLAFARALEGRLARTRSENWRLNAIIEASGAIVAVVSSDGRLDSFTPQFMSLFEYGSHARSEKQFAAFFSPQAEPKILQALSNALLGKEETLLLTRQDRGGLLEASFRHLAGDAGKVCVSLRVHLPFAPQPEAALLGAEQKGAAQSSFLAQISHEIRTPLNAIAGFAEIMMEERFGPLGSDRYREYLKDIRTAGLHALSLINDLLDLSKIKAGKMALNRAPIDVNEAIEECVSIMQAQANQSRILIRTALAPALPLIYGDARALRQILLNLISNAVKFNVPGGQVIVSTTIVEAHAIILRVKDTGIGMSDQEALTALEPFTQLAARSDTRGTGLGLSLTKALVEASRATMSIKSDKRAGTLVEISFPISNLCAAE